MVMGYFSDSKMKLPNFQTKQNKTKNLKNGGAFTVFSRTPTLGGKPPRSVM